MLNFAAGVAFSIFLTAAIAGAAAIEGNSIRVSITSGAETSETVQIRENGEWIDALKTSGAVIQARGADKCTVQSADVVNSKLVVKGSCSNGAFSRTFELGRDSDTISVTVQFTPAAGAAISSIEDRMTFAPAPRKSDTPVLGPLDFVWSPGIKAQRDQVAAHWTFKSPSVMFQQGPVFTALVPALDSLTSNSLRYQPTALDLDVTSEDHAWFSYGVVESKPYGHSYFLRTGARLDNPAGPIEYRYWILASAQPAKLGYRRVSQFEWEKFGSSALRSSLDLQRNDRRPELFLFDDWRREAWTRYADEKYWETDCDGRRCGALTSNRNPWGKWDEAPKEDAWFNSWFQNLRSAYGWRLYAQHSNNPEISRKAENILNLALSSPRHEGVFSTIYLHDSNQWLHEDGWAGFPDDYHTFCMSWTGYWMLRWTTDLAPSRAAEVMAFLRPYADFLLKVQQPNGDIPSWFSERLEARAEFRDFNAETAGSALFLAQFSEFSKDPKYLEGAKRAQQFIADQVIPRQRWFDFETFLSCARKPFDFYDRWTAQYPQNNLSTMQAAQALLKIYKMTGDPQYLTQGEQVVDYLLLTQQVWNHPLVSPKLVGGTTTQNTDAEWSDARQCYLAALLLDYYQADNRFDYLERAVAAARSGFAVAPWENWAHQGYADVHGSLTGFHWGTGSQMATVEMMAPVLGDAFVNVARQHGVGFNACNVNNVKVTGETVAFNVEAAAKPRRILVRFAGLDRHAKYRLIVNNGKAKQASGEELAANGYWVEL